MVNNKITEIGNKRYSIDHIKNSVKYIKKCITEIETEIEGVKKEKNTFSEGVNDLEEKINNIKNEISSLKKVINLMDVVKFVVSEEGVKSFIVKKILSHFNSKLTHFLKKLDSNCVCMFNEYFEEEIVNEKGKISLYNNFSGAERKAIDLACLFSFMDMRKAQGDVHYNISFYDELFDSSLDEKGVELVLEILNERVEKLNECVMVISHRKESIKSATGDVIFLEKHNGITKRVSFID
jgi:DNA repair exonuclease SbcCD ATPase subunit